jgi:hypothetical protein
VGAIVFIEDFIAPGDGKLFSVKFRMKDDVITDEVITVDTTRIPPAYLLLSHSNATNIYPMFRAGTITVAEENRPPAFDPVPELYVAEGDTVSIDLHVTDPDGDSVIIANPIHTYFSDFTDLGNGHAQLIWCPDFVGPLSADLSPFNIVFWASDGTASAYINVKVNVINVNRSPQINAPSLVEAEAGDSLGISISAVDPDFEMTEWEVYGLPQGATFDFNNPGIISWVSNFADSGSYQITLIASDPYDLADTAEIEIDLAPATLFSLRIDTVSAFSGDIVELDIMMKNKFEIKEFDLLIRLDPVVLTTMEISNTDSRSAHFDDFSYRINENFIDGDVRITGMAGQADPIAEGEGVLCRIKIQISPNLTYVGNQVPVQFVSHSPEHNSLVLADDQVISEDQINLFGGYILISSPGQILLGDINLNGIAYEISDAVYFSNFFISPGLYPLDEQQLVNSDINRDGFAPSVADLVVMIKVIAGEVAPPTVKVIANSLPVLVEMVRDHTGVYLSIDSPVDLGGAFYQFAGPDAAEISPINLTEMDMMVGVANKKLSCLLLSYTNETISSGETSVIWLSDDPELNVELEAIDIADDRGRSLTIEEKQSVALPTGFALHQNHPNPFNPITEIRFELDRQVLVTLSVYNILGQEVIRLTDSEYPAGSHAVIWDGTDDNGQQVASGIYLYQIKAGDFSAGRKMVLLK